MITATVPPSLNWMLRDFADVSIEDDDEPVWQLRTLYVIVTSTNCFNRNTCEFGQSANPRPTAKEDEMPKRETR